MKGSLLLIACLLALTLMSVEGKSVLKQKEEPNDKETETEGDSEDKEVEDSSASGSGSGKYLDQENLFHSSSHMCLSIVFANIKPARQPALTQQKGGKDSKQTQRKLRR